MSTLFKLGEIITGLVDTIRRMRTVIVDDEGNESHIEPPTLYGDIGDRPLADAVRVGTVYVVVDDNLPDVYISDGTDWKDV